MSGMSFGCWGLLACPFSRSMGLVKTSATSSLGSNSNAPRPILAALLTGGAVAGPREEATFRPWQL